MIKLNDPKNKLGLSLLSLAIAMAIWVWFSGFNALFDPISVLDAYIYTGYGYNYPSHDYIPGYYKISRLPWVFLQVILRRIVRPELATPFLAVCLVAAQGLLSYLLAFRLTRHRLASLLIGSFVLTAPLWHNIGGWNYHAHPGVLFLWLTLILLPLTREEASPERYFIAFSIFALGLHVQPLILICCPMVAIFCLIPVIRIRPAGGFRNKLRAYAGELCTLGVRAAAAITVVTALLCLLHKIFYGEWLFFMPNIKTMLWLSKGYNPWHESMSWKWLEPGGGWLYISFLLAIALVSLVLMVIKPGKTSAGCGGVLPRLAGVMFLAAAGGFLAAHAKGTEALSMNYHTYVLQCVGIIPLAFFIAWLLPEYKSFRLPLLIAPLLIGSLNIAVAASGRSTARFLSTYCKYPLAALAAVILLLVLLRQFRRKWNTAVKCVLLALFFTLPVAYGFSGYRKDNAPLNRILLRHYERLLRINAERKHAGGATTALHNVFRIAVLNNDTVGDSLPADQFAASLGELGLTSINYDCCSLVLDNFDPESTEIPDGVHFVMIGGNPDVGERAKEMLAEKKLNPVLVDSGSEFDSGFSVFMWVFKVSYFSPDQAEPFIERLETHGNLEEVMNFSEVIGFSPPISDIKDVLINPELLYECTDLSQFQFSAYGGADSNPPSPMEKIDGHIQYTTKNDRDHIASPYLSLSGKRKKIAIHIKYTEFCEVIAQGDDYQYLATIKCNTADGDVTKAFTVPSGNKTVRVSIQPGRKTTLILPDAIEIWEGD